MKRFLLLGSASALVLAAVACGGSAASVSDPDASPTIPGSGTPEGGPITPHDPVEAGPDAAPPPPPPPAKCTEIANTGTNVTAHTVGAAAPTATGGTLKDGTYHLTDLSVYTGTGASSPLALVIKGTIAIHGNAVDFVQDTQGKHMFGTQGFTQSGTGLTFTTVCGTAPPSAMTYSAGETLQMFLPNDVGQIVGYTYEK